jgi:hypothetical protein
MTIINNQYSLLEGIFSLFYEDYEHKITNNDSIILEFNSELYQITKTSDISSNINCKYYSYGINQDIKKTILFEEQYLSNIEPQYDITKKSYKLKSISKLFEKYCKLKNIKLYPSIYNTLYYNIYNDFISFGICKIEYIGKETSRFIIGYDKTLLDKSKIITIIKNIFIDVKN